MTGRLGKKKLNRDDSHPIQKMAIVGASLVALVGPDVH